MARAKMPRWFWPLLAAGCVLLLLLEVLLRHSGGAGESEGGAAGAGAGNRKPFPKGGEFSAVRRPQELEPRERSAPQPSAPQPWQNGRKSQ